MSKSFHDYVKKIKGNKYKKKIIGVIVYTILYPLFTPLIQHIPNPMVENADIAINMIFPVLAGIFFGPISGAISGGLGTFLGYIIGKSPFDFYAIIPHLVMGGFSGIIAKKNQITWISTSSILIGHLLNLIVFQLVGLNNFLTPSLGENVLGIITETMIEIITMLFIIELHDYFSAISKLKSRNHSIIHRKTKLNFEHAFIAFGIWLLILILIILSSGEDHRILNEIIISSLVIPILYISIFYNKLISLLFALISSIVVSFYLFQDPNILYSPFSKRVMFHLIFQNIVALVANDLNERYKNAQNKLKFHTEYTPIAVIEVDKDLKVIKWNPSATQFFGYELDEVLGKELITLIAPNQKRIEIQNKMKTFLSARINEKSFEIHHNQTKSGELLYCEWIYTRIFNNHGEIAGLAFIIENISLKMKYYENELREQKMKTLEVLAGTLCHDLNNIFTSVIFSLDLLENEEFKPNIAAKDKKPIINLKNSINHAMSLTRRLQNFTQSQNRNNYKKVDISKIIIETADLLTQGTKIDMQYILAENIPQILIEPDQIRQIISNLIINAIEAMENTTKKQIIIQVKDFRNSNSLNYLLANQNYIEIKITDSGPGIPEEIQREIFTPYFTTKETGCGLGLVSCSYIIKKHGGHIQFESNLGGGTSFFIYLPIDSTIRG